MYQLTVGLTDVTEHDATNRALVKVGQKNTQEHGQIYQIAVSRQGHHPDEEGEDPGKEINFVKIARACRDIYDCCLPEFVTSVQVFTIDRFNFKIPSQKLFLLLAV